MDDNSIKANGSERKRGTVTSRINEIKQPRGGFIKPSDFGITDYNDGLALFDGENVHGVIVGLAVDYLSRFMTGASKLDAFYISIQGAILANRVRKESYSIANTLLENINGLDDTSIINACKLVSFDVWKRNIFGAAAAKGYQDINPNVATIENIRIMVNRSVSFFDNYGPVTQQGFTFEPYDMDDEDVDVSAMEDAYSDMIISGKGSFGGYTPTVCTGDGDFLTKDTMWDFKVSVRKPTSKHTLQLLMYWVMGQHSGRSVFKEIRKIGIFNPRFNTVYLLDIANVPTDIIRTIEDEVICYPKSEEE